MDNIIDYEFASTGGGEATGLNDPVTTAFKSDVNFNLARESLQNIIDATTPGSSEPARAEFVLTKIKSHSLPNWEKLKEILLACRDTYSNQPDTCNFFEKAADKLNKDSLINILKISDYNTTGMTGGDDDPDGNYFSFLKAVGSSSKAGGHGGSFGLGKGAYFVASGFRMIFVSSTFSDQSLFQGKLRLASHMWNGDRKQGNGSYGLPLQKPIRNKELIPTEFKRIGQGTDIFIIDYANSEDWENEIIKSVLDNFWNAIFRRLIIVKVGSVLINDENLDDLLHKYYSEEETDSKDSPNPLPYYHTYMDKNPFIKTLPTLGEVKLYVDQKSNYPKKVALIRLNGMTIDRRRFDFLGNFAGVFICENDKGNRVLRRMENEQHTEWKPSNAKGSLEESNAKYAEKEIKEFIKSVLDSIRPTDKIKSLTIPGLEKYLFLPGENPDSNPSGSNEDEATEFSTRETGVESGSEKTEVEDEKKVTRIPVINTAVTPGTSGGGFPILDKNGRGGKKHGEGGKPDENGDKKVILLSNVSCRTFAQKNVSGQYSHLVLLKGPENVQFYLEVKAGTEDVPDAISVLKASDSENRSLSINGNRIEGLKFDLNGNMRLKLILDGNNRYSLNVSAYANS